MTTRYLPYIQAASKALSDRKEEVNRLNVFPVPDGDTGTNMSLTMESVVSSVAKLPDDATLDEVCKAVVQGSLMGARGNSGVITSQILRGICEGISGCTAINAEVISAALSKAVEVAFKAVRKPVEGTILTVLRDASEAAKKACEAGASLEESLHAVATESFASVRRTPELLPVLKENGVVDSGAFGLAVLFEGFSNAVCGGELAIPNTYKDFKPKVAPKVEIEHIEDWEGSEYLYCTEFLLYSDKIERDDALAFLATMGDCELLVGERPNYKVHVHTNTPGAVLTYMTDRGQVSEVFIHNMKLQSDDRAEGIAAEDKACDPAQKPHPHKALGFVAVGAGAGIERILESIGVDIVVSGGQTMNPPTSELVEAAAAANADAVILFPNNKNIIMTANTAAELSNVPLGIVPTKNVTQCFASMIVYDASATLAQNVESMTQAAEEVAYAEVTHAIRDAKTSKDEQIREGDFIGIMNGSLDFVGKSVEEVVLAMLENMITEDSDTLTILAGEDFSDDRLDALVETIEGEYDSIEVDAQRGDQPVYPIVLSVE